MVLLVLVVLSFVKSTSIITLVVKYLHLYFYSLRSTQDRIRGSSFACKSTGETMFNDIFSQTSEIQSRVHEFHCVKCSNRLTTLYLDADRIIEERIITSP